jgi:hypothetical protein
MLPEEAFQKVGKSVKLYGKGGGSPAPTSQTVTQTNLPEYARPYFENLLNRTQAQSYQNYQPYGGARVAGFTPEQQGIQQEYAGMQTPGQFGQATSGLQATGGLGMGAAAMGLGQALNYRPGAYNPQNVGTQAFGQGAADYYSNPFQQNVTNTALREAQQKGALDKNALMSGAIGRGTFGGARNALLQAEQNRGLNQQLGDIQYKGSADAYTNAQQQFQADQARQMQASLANQQAGLSANQQNQQAQQYAAGLGQQLFGTGLQGAQQSATGLGALGAQQQTTDLARLDAQNRSAAQQQALQQTQLDTAYQDFLRQRDYPQEQLGFYSNILRGLPVQLASTQSTYQAPPNIGSQIAGVGLGLAGLSKLA